MLKKINFQFLLSYLGLLPFSVILFDKFFFKLLDYNIVNDFSIFYSIIIFVFIGAINWNLKKNISILIVLLGFIPSLVSVLIILMFLYYGKIPWQNQESVSSILKIKEDFGWKNEIIGEFVLFITYCRNLGFTDKPNYKYLHNMISNLMILSE